MPGFNLNSVKYFLTYPQCQTTKEEFIANLEQYFPDQVKQAAVARELHQDGNPHLHAIVIWNAKKHLRNAATLDVLTKCHDHPDGKHGKYESCRSLHLSAVYLLKSDPAPLQLRMDLRAIANKKSSKTALIAEGILNGDTISDVVDANPGFAMMNMNKIINFVQYASRKRKHDELAAWTDLVSTTPDVPNAYEIVQWVNENCQPGIVRPFKASQLWLYGDPAMGKTSLALILEKRLIIYRPKYDEDFYCGFDDEYDNLVVFDEFSGQKKVTFLNEFVQGSPMNLRVKGGTVQKKTNLPVIVLSNLHPRECYPNVPQVKMNALLSRFEVLKLEEPCFFDFAEQ